MLDAAAKAPGGSHVPQPTRSNSTRIPGRAHGQPRSIGRQLSSCIAITLVPGGLSGGDGCTTCVLLSSPTRCLLSLPEPRPVQTLHSLPSTRHTTTATPPSPLPIATTICHCHRHLHHYHHHFHHHHCSHHRPLVYPCDDPPVPRAVDHGRTHAANINSPQEHARAHRRSFATTEQSRRLAIQPRGNDHSRYAPKSRHSYHGARATCLARFAHARRH